MGHWAKDFENHNFAYNWHTNSTRPETFESDKGLNEFWEVTSVGKTENGT